MATARLTDRIVASLTCPPGKSELLSFDATVPGFMVSTSPGGTRTFYLRYTVDGRKPRYRIGVFGQDGMTTAKARQEAERQRGLVLSDRNPVAERKAAKAEAARIEAEQAFTFFDLVTAWRENMSHRRPRYLNDATARLRRYFKAWQDRPAAGVTKAEVVLAVDRIAKEHGVISARRGLAYARAAYNWAVGRDMLGVNPFDRVKPPGKETPRERVLLDPEIGAIWRAADRLSPIHGAYVRLLLLTLQRREEAGAMQWDELSDDLTTWSLPGARAKNGRTSIVHIPPIGRDLLRSLPGAAAGPFVFPGRTPAGAITVYAAIKAALLKVIRQERQSAGLLPADLPDWRFHDFRRTGVTFLARAGFAPHVCDRLLNHTSGVISGVAAVYQKHDFAAERQRALEAWAAHVVSCADGIALADCKVVQLRGA